MIYLIKSIGYKEGEEGKISTFFLLKIGYIQKTVEEEYKSDSGWKIKTLMYGN